MTNIQKIIHSLTHNGPQCDDCLSESARITPRQTVNQICRGLAQQNVIERERYGYCPRCGRHKITNHPSKSAAPRRNAPPPSPQPTGRPRNHDVEALSEDEIKKVLAEHLERSGWTVQVAWGGAQGVDIDARQGEARWLIEVKGPGSRPPMRVNYFLAILGELLQRMDDPQARYSIALPDLPQYRRLWERLPTLAKTRTGIDALFVDLEGHIDRAR